MLFMATKWETNSPWANKGLIYSFIHSNHDAILFVYKHGTPDNILKLICSHLDNKMAYYGANKGSLCRF